MKSYHWVLLGIGSIGLGVSSPVAASEMHRVYNPNSGEHFYTASTIESQNLISLGWKDEGIGWYAPEVGEDVYRLYNPNTGDHHYTLTNAEKEFLLTKGWKDEGIGWKSDTRKEILIYRAYNPNAKSGSHNYTSSLNEQAHLASVGWKSEGIGWYGQNPEGDGELYPEITKQLLNGKSWYEGASVDILMQPRQGFKNEKFYNLLGQSFDYTITSSEKEVYSILDYRQNSTVSVDVTTQLLIPKVDAYGNKKTDTFLLYYKSDGTLMIAYSTDTTNTHATYIGFPLENVSLLSN